MIHQFLKFLGLKAVRDIAQLSAQDIVAFPDRLGRTVTAGTTNISIKIIRPPPNQARRDSLADTNEAERVTLLKRTNRFERRPFTLAELRRILAVANGQWRRMILFGLYTVNALATSRACFEQCGTVPSGNCAW